ncbi:pseudouridine synthase [Marispirochaeta sp.]|jgi:23S rRNA pseudouridine2605 synthase|uniref:pseudouridine synthase n=1 Tax=Marispirochaeta sp. TaxID=2038653 RepID=UPI0029C7BAB5|nr:pseudouridine synthase [Marispirochaeta sp.]
MADKKDNEIRLQVFLARSGIASRRGSEDLIRQGRVRVNGKVVTRMGEKVSLNDSVEVDHKKVYPDRRFIYIALYKPKFVVSSLKDPEGRTTVADIIKGKFPFRLFHVGRLDYLSSGLMFLTNDGEFSRFITSPAVGIEKEYQVEVSRLMSTELLDSFVRGIRIEDEELSISSYKIVGEKVAYLILKEGKNREIRRLFHHHKIRVKKLHRVRIGSVKLKGMVPGEYRLLKERDLRELGYKNEGALWS